jgi:hypothetical protein
MGFLFSVDTIDEIVVRVEIRNSSNVQQFADEPGLLKKVIFNGMTFFALQYV